MSLEEPVEQWASVAVNKSVDSHKKDTRDDFIREKYEINTSVDMFIEKVFNLVK